MYKKYLKNLKTSSKFPCQRLLFIYRLKKINLPSTCDNVRASALHCPYASSYFFVFRVRTLEVEHLTVSFKS